MRSKQRVIEENIESIKNMFEDRIPLCQISKNFNMKYDTFRKWLIFYGFEMEKCINPGRKNIPREKRNAMYYIENDIDIASSKLRTLLIRDNIKERRCERCKRDTWMDMPIPLELHHIDGDHKNNKLENLMVLCSNCHMQMHGYSNVD